MAGRLDARRTGFFDTIRRLVQLWGIAAHLDLLFVTRGMRDFLLYVGADAVLHGSIVTAMLLLAERFDGMGTWSKAQVAFMLGYALTVTGILETLFGYNILWISRRLGRGQWDHTLIQPQPLWMALVTEGFAPFSGSATLLPGVGLMVWSGARLSLSVTPAWLVLLAIHLAASAVVVVAYSFLWGSLAFWAPQAAEEISTSSLRLMYALKSFPLDGLGPALLGGLLTVVPVGFVAWYPCRALLGLETQAGAAAVNAHGGSPWSGVVTPIAAVALGALAAWVFRRGMEQYARTGSQRYLSRGFRR